MTRARDAATPRAVVSAVLTGDRLRAETELRPRLRLCREVERERRQAVCDTKHVGARGCVSSLRKRRSTAASSTQ